MNTPNSGLAIKRENGRGSPEIGWAQSTPVHALCWHNPSITVKPIDLLVSATAEKKHWTLVSLLVMPTSDAARLQRPALSEGCWCPAEPGPHALQGAPAATAS